MGDVHGVGRRRDGGPARGAHEIAHEAREGALLLRAARETLLRGIALVAVAVGARALGARRRGIHLAGKGSEGGRLAQGGGLEAGGLVGVEGVGMLGRRGSAWRRVPTGSSCGRSVQSLVDGEGVEGSAHGRRGQVGEGRCRGRIIARRDGVRLELSTLLLVDGREQRRRATQLLLLCAGMRGCDTKAQALLGLELVRVGVGGVEVARV